MELPALKVGKLRPTPVVRGGITLYTGESEAIGISPTPIDFIEEQELFIHDSDGTYPLVSSYSFKWKNEMG